MKVKGSILLLLFLSATLFGADTNDYTAAADYLESKNGNAMLVYENGERVFERYLNGWKRDRGHRLASGTKSFTGALLAVAVDDKLLGFDEKVSDTITEWQKDPQLAGITIRQLLSLTSGIDGGKIGVIPSYAEAVTSAERKRKPDVGFSYGPVPFQLFGELLHRKLAKSEPAETVEAYMQRKILEPIGCEPALWRKDEAGQLRLPSGAAFTALEWAAFGLLMVNRGKHGDRQIISEAALAECWTGSKAKPNYGLGFWLSDKAGFELVMAAGMGKQKLFIVPSKKLLIVQFAEAKGYDQSKFLRLALGQDKDAAAPVAEAAEPADPERIPLWAKTRFNRFDKNKDGKVTAAEVPNAARLQSMDQNNNGSVDLTEYWSSLRSR